MRHEQAWGEQRVRHQRSQQEFAEELGLLREQVEQAVSQYENLTNREAEEQEKAAQKLEDAAEDADIEHNRFIWPARSEYRGSSGGIRTPEPCGQ